MPSYLGSFNNEPSWKDVKAKEQENKGTISPQVEVDVAGWLFSRVNYVEVQRQTEVNAHEFVVVPHSDRCGGTTAA